MKDFLTDMRKEGDKDGVIWEGHEHMFDVCAVLRETKSEAMHEDNRAGTSCSVPAMRDAEDVS